MGLGGLGCSGLVPVLGTAACAGKVPLSSVKNRGECYVACKDPGLGGLLGLNSALHENLAFPISSWLVPPDMAPKSLMLLLSWSSLVNREGKLRHMGSASWAVLPLIFSNLQVERWEVAFPQLLMRYNQII